MHLYGKRIGGDNHGWVLIVGGQSLRFLCRATALLYGATFYPEYYNIQIISP